MMNSEGICKISLKSQTGHATKFAWKCVSYDRYDTNGTQSVNGKVIPSSPEITSKLAGLFLMMSSICEMFPDASLMAITFLKSRAIRKVVSAVILTPVRPGTLSIRWVIRWLRHSLVVLINTFL